MKTEVRESIVGHKFSIDQNGEITIEKCDVDEGLHLIFDSFSNVCPSL